MTNERAPSTKELLAELAATRAELEAVRRAARGQVLASEELNRRIIEAMPGGIVHVAADGAILTANSEALRILGLSYDRLTQRYVRDFDTETIWEDGSPCPASEYPVSLALTTGKPQPPATIGVRRPDGQIYWAVFTAVPVIDPESGAAGSVVVTFLDITARKRTEEALRRSEGLLRSVLESAPNPIAMSDADGDLVFVSNLPSGHDPHEVLGRPAWAGLVAEDHAMVKEHLARVVATGELRAYEATALNGNRWLVHVGPRRDGDTITGATFVAWDVTKMRDLERRVAIADRMASIGTLAAGVAHEINNPLTYLLANLEWLASESRGDARPHDRLVAALEGARRIRDVVSNVRHFSHVGEARRVLLDVHEILESALRMAQSETRWRARVTTKYGAAPAVLASEGRLGQVFLNLIVNAAQAIPEGDIEHNEITISTGVDERGWVVVEVGDTGSGIAPELLEKIFDPFVTTKPRGVGTGLGLYICKNVVASLGGEISVRSEHGEGSTFRVALPACTSEGAASGTAAAPAPAAASAGRRLKILVADDEAAIVNLVRGFLSEHDVTAAHGGREAIELLSTQSFDLALCDLVMPDITGMDVYEALRERHPGRERCLVLMTGGAFTERAREFLDGVPNVVLEKPFTLADLARVVAEYASARPA